MSVKILFLTHFNGVNAVLLEENFICSFILPLTQPQVANQQQQKKELLLYNSYSHCCGGLVYKRKVVLLGGAPWSSGLIRK